MHPFHPPLELLMAARRKDQGQTGGFICVGLDCVPGPQPVQLVPVHPGQGLDPGHAPD